jgi:hypothetical protein
MTAAGTILQNGPSICVHRRTDTHPPVNDILVRTERGMREVTTEEWGKLKGYPSYWGTTAKDRRRIIQEPSLHFWSVLGDAFAPTLIHP